MDSKATLFLTSVLGTDGAQALCKAAERSTALEQAILPRAVVAWVRSVTSSFEGTIPGIENSYVRFAKNEAGYGGSLSVNEQIYDFSGATQEHVASAVLVALSLDLTRIAPGARDMDIARLGKSIDLLVRARAATALLKAQVKGQRHGVAAEPLKPEEQEAPTAPTKQQIPPKPPQPKPHDYVPAAPRAKVQYAKVKLPGVKIMKSEVPLACRECGTRTYSAAGTLRGCLCVRDLLKSVDIQDQGDSFALAFGPGLDHDEQSFIVDTLGANRGR